MAETRVKSLGDPAEVGRDELRRAGSTLPQTVPEREGGELRRAEGSAAAAAPSFERIVAEQQERVARLCYRLIGWDADVDDVVQEAFLRVFRALSEYRGESSVSTWITRIAINACHSHARKRGRVLRLLTGAWRHGRERAERPADVRPMDDERFGRVRDAVRGLPVKYREVVVLRYLEDMAVKDIGEVLGLSRNAVEVRLNRARRQLKEELAGLALQ